MYILHTSPMVLMKRICVTIKALFNYVTISTIWSDVTVRLIKQCLFFLLCFVCLIRRMIRCWLGAACFSRSHNYNLHDFGEGAVVRGCNLQVAGRRLKVRIWSTRDNQRLTDFVKKKTVFTASRKPEISIALGNGFFWEFDLAARA